MIQPPSSSAVPAIAAPEEDAELLRLCAQFEENEQEFDRLNELGQATQEGGPAREKIDRETRANVDLTYDLREAISDLPAKTPGGVRAKVKVGLADLLGGQEWLNDPATWVVTSVLRDILAVPLGRLNGTTSL